MGNSASKPKKVTPKKRAASARAVAEAEGPKSHKGSHRSSKGSAKLKSKSGGSVRSDSVSSQTRSKSTTAPLLPLSKVEAETRLRLQTRGTQKHPSGDEAARTFTFHSAADAENRASSSIRAKEVRHVLAPKEESRMIDAWQSYRGIATEADFSEQDGEAWVGAGRKKPAVDLPPPVPGPFSYV